MTIFASCKNILSHYLIQLDNVGARKGRLTSQSVKHQRGTHGNQILQLSGGK